MSRRPRVPGEMRTGMALDAMAPGGRIPSESPVVRRPGQLMPPRQGGGGVAPAVALPDPTAQGGSIDAVWGTSPPPALTYWDFGPDAVEGDLLVFCYFGMGDRTLADMPTGFTEFEAGSHGDMTYRFCWGVFDPADPQPAYIVSGADPLPIETETKVSMILVQKFRGQGDLLPTLTAPVVTGSGATSPTFADATVGGLALPWQVMAYRPNPLTVGQAYDLTLSWGPLEQPSGNDAVAFEGAVLFAPEGWPQRTGPAVSTLPGDWITYGMGLA